MSEGLRGTRFCFHNSKPTIVIGSLFSLLRQLIIETFISTDFLDTKIDLVFPRFDVNKNNLRKDRYNVDIRIRTYFLKVPYLQVIRKDRSEDNMATSCDQKS